MQGMAQKAEDSKPWFTDLILTYQPMPVTKKKKSKAARRNSERLALIGWATQCPKVFYENILTTIPPTVVIHF